MICGAFLCLVPLAPPSARIRGMNTTDNAAEAEFFRQRQVGLGPDSHGVIRTNLCGLSGCLSVLRWKLFRLASRFFLGKTFGDAMLGLSASLDFEDEQVLGDLRSHVTAHDTISDPETVFYDYHGSVPQCFRSASAYGTKSAWLLRNVFVSPKHGAIWTPEGKLLQESVTNLAVFYLFGGPKETLLSAKMIADETPFVPFRSNLVYYHTLLDDLPQLLHALDFRPDSRILLSRNHPGYIDDMLAFLGIDPSRIVLSDSPLMVRFCVFVPKLTRTSFIRPCDLNRLRAALLPRIAESGHGRRIYISRRGTKLRAFSNEKELEDVLRADGFEILRFEDMPFADQLTAVRSSRVIVAPHGSGLANLVAAREGTRVVEISPSYWLRSTFPRLCSQLGLDHRMVLCDTDRIPVDQVLNAINGKE